MLTSVAMNLSGINNMLNYDKTFIRFKTINEGIICKSGPIIFVNFHWIQLFV